MEVTLKEVDKQNYEQVCDLDVAKHQEDYVACNMWSLVESMFNDNHVTRAIYQGDRTVGFFMWVKETSDKISIWRFMVDQRYQQAGIGRVALNLALDEIRQVAGVKFIEICYNPKNPVAKSFYESFGFKEIGMDEDGEDMLAQISL